MDIKGSTGVWEYVIGLEVHAQIDSKSKLFSPSAASFGSDPNSNASIIDVAFPGTLPVLNGFCLEQAVKTALGLNARVNLFSAFDRKSYFYPDLPSGYQISQFYRPIAEKGWLSIETESGAIKRIEIERLHLEQDAGKSIHDLLPGYTCMDFNRAGVPLMEIVSTPCISSPFEAGAYLKKLRNLVRHLGSCTGDMEKGALRCDANVSIRRKGELRMGQRCEIKNLNSIKHIVKALEFEGQRQVKVLESGGCFEHETRGFDPEKGITYLMRSKEESKDYRYFPEPDLPPVVLSQEYVNSIASRLPELPEAMLERYVATLGLGRADAAILASNKSTAAYFEQAIALGANAKKASNWVISVLFALGDELLECNFSPRHLAELINLIEEGRVSNSAAKSVCEEIFNKGGEVLDVVKSLNLLQITDEEEIFSIVDSVIKQEAATVESYLLGKEKVFSALVAAALKKSGGRASPPAVHSALKQRLSPLVKNSHKS
jgi:aspartyl-tRNA(Asn)/glutamyl-tRNA(Gln) amidotransferase subunit B